MCGIAGVIGQLPDKQRVMQQMLEVQHHRGPDARGMADLGEQGILGHNRLRILDMAAEANQPFHSRDGRFTLVFNGEIYNYLEIRTVLSGKYVFHTQSDTEVLLCAYQEWGSACLERLIGMFAFAIWDYTIQRLFAARDRFGVKPFYYSVRDHQFYFASEIKALWSAGIPKQPNRKVWAGYLTFGTYGMPQETFWEGISQLPGGHYLEYVGGRYNVGSWYDFVKQVEKQPRLDEQEAIATWTKLAMDSICLRFRADVPVGFNLSGGLDSSLLLGMIHQQYPGNADIEAFTFYTGDERYDELYWVEKMIESTQFPLNKVRLTAEEVPYLAAELSWFEDEPYGGIPTIAYSKLFQRAREKGIRVLLDGQGMDEAWAGYDYYQENTEHLVQGTSDSPVRPDCLEPSFKNRAQKPVFPTPFDNKLQNMQYRDLFYTKIPRALRFNDRISMMHCVELREPFLDHRLVELAFSLPVAYKINYGQGKWLLRQIASGWLPEGFALAPKRPVQTPQREWLAGALNSWVQSGINQLSTHPWFQYREVRNTWSEYRKGNIGNSFFLWQWISVPPIR